VTSSTAAGREPVTTCGLLQPGCVDYAEAWKLQRRLVEARSAGEIGDVLILLEHPHVYTLGRLADESNVLSDEAALRQIGAKLYRIDRGGDVTYHGPGQLVGYPIVDLRLRGSDVHQYVRDLEEVLIRVLAEFGVAGAERPATAGLGWWRESRGHRNQGLTLDREPRLRAERRPRPRLLRPHNSVRHPGSWGHVAEQAGRLPGEPGRGRPGANSAVRRHLRLRSPASLTRRPQARPLARVCYHIDSMPVTHNVENER